MKKIIVKPRLGEIMKEKGITQTELANLSGVSQSAISRFDKSTRADYALIYSLSMALGVTTDDLFEITEIEEEE